MGPKTGFCQENDNSRRKIARFFCEDSEQIDDRRERIDDRREQIDDWRERLDDRGERIDGVE